MLVRCQYTNISFEAKSKMAKNHPEISAFLGELYNEQREANKRQSERVRAALFEGQSLGFTKPEQFIDHARQVAGL
jgi:hypothetical protein